MPVKRYFRGRGEQVMREMKAKHGAEKGERMFYATAHEQGQMPREGRRHCPKCGMRHKRGHPGAM